jgi:hypothetical protein
VQEMVSMLPTVVVSVVVALLVMAVILEHL